MPITRHETQDYATVAAIVAETLIPTNNDSIFVEEIRREFHWSEGSTLVADGQFVIDQTAATALGRWVVSSASNVYTGTGNTDDMENGQQSTIDITVTGVSLAQANLIAITNANTFANNLFVSYKEVVAADTVRVTVDNQTGASVSSFPVNVTVIAQ